MGRISRLRLKRRNNGKRQEEGITPAELAVLGGASLPDNGPQPGKAPEKVEAPAVDGLVKTEN